MKFSLELRPGKLKTDEISIPLAILAVIAMAGFLTIVGARLDVLKMLKQFKNKKSYCPSRVTYYLDSLIKQGLIIKDKNDRLSLSQKGELRLLKYQGELKPKKKWDGKWRIVTFDIWERSRRKRNFLRNELSEFGFVKLQNSVWIAPYDCEEYINLLKTGTGVGQGVIYIVADQIDNDFKLKKIFDLV